MAFRCSAAPKGDRYGVGPIVDILAYRFRCSAALKGDRHESAGPDPGGAHPVSMLGRPGTPPPRSGGIGLASARRFDARPLWRATATDDLRTVLLRVGDVSMLGRPEG